LARQEGRARAVYDALIVIVENYLRLRPDNAEARKRYVELLEGSVEGSDRAARQFSAVTDFYRLHPIEPYTCILMANQCFDQELDKAASILLETAARLNPFSPFNDHEVGMCYRRNSYNAKAVEYLAKFMEAVPTRSDVAIEWAWSMCEMGHYKEPRVREAFAAAVGRYSGNAGFQVHNIDYLLYWAKDREAALQAAENLYAIFPTANYLDYQFRIALADGQTTRALDLLRQMKPEEGAAGLSLSAHHAAMVERYLQVNRADLARPHLEIAMSIDSWQQPVIRAMGNMAYAEGNFEQAMAQYERALDRYEFNPETVTAIAACLDKLGRPQEAAERLERDFLAASHPLRANLVPSLLYFMADAGDLNKMDGFLDALVRSRGRTRALVWQAVEAYRKIDPKFSEAVWADIDRIMAAPDYTLPAHGDGATSATGGAGAADPSSGERSDN
jgi:tetratricopeptide (TPR) repeat protein